MSAGLSRIERISFGKRSLVLLFALMLLGLGAWLFLPASNGHVAGTKPPSANLASLQTDPSASEAATVGLAASSADAAELQGLRISSQTWRRGGLGSKALVTFTLRNDNDYAVKDVEIACAFNRRDGSHLTDRRRVLPETVSMKSRKTFAQVHIGFVNINASQAKCSAVAARRT
ncbi:hypothetical protein JQ596_24700 [Bradyrhizobium manausense]|uniref:hypothetical protein n=1 Tax=Bradyrhizobium TaxID=374 RepID=UPI001BAA86ED|nr:MULTISPECIES: hypothetical protein [Bradyrhizobium]MBR0828740.1 hypothetical protein [Bradyrhizobium manausense]UVO32556.1 hypothetical protein KUF59_18965 [Bradyrhizobium arachidis]